MTDKLAMPLMASQQVMKHDSCLAQWHTTLSLFVFECWYPYNTLPEACCSTTRWRIVSLQAWFCHLHS